MLLWKAGLLTINQPAVVVCLYNNLIYIYMHTNIHYTESMTTRYRTLAGVEFCVIYVNTDVNRDLVDGNTITTGPQGLKKFRPVSNFTYSSEIIERVVVIRLNRHLIQNGLHEVLQSAYEQNHSTETALLKVLNDLLIAIDTHGGAVLILFDLSAAFDYIDHIILLQRLRELESRETGSDPIWASGDNSLLSMVYDHYIEICPQGSVPCPILFTLYITPLAAIARIYQLNLHFYADDTELYQPSSQAVRNQST